MTIQVGETLVMHCFGCKKEFEWTVLNGWWSGVPTHCSRNCKVRHKNRRRREREYHPCPRKDKKLYVRQESAFAAAVQMGRKFQVPLAVYRCVCGGLHVGRVKFKRKESA